MSSRFKYAILDKDGVLFDSMGLFRDLFNELLVDFAGAISPLTQEQYNEIASTNWDESLGTWIPPKKDRMEFVRRFNAAVPSRVIEAPVFDGVPFILESMQAEGIQLFVSSKAMQENVNHMLESSGLSDYFDRARGRRGDYFSKQKHFEEFAVVSGVSLETFYKNAFILEDTPHEVATAQGLGLYGIGITTTHSRERFVEQDADAIIDEHRELLSVINQEIL